MTQVRIFPITSRATRLASVLLAWGALAGSVAVAETSDHSAHQAMGHQASTVQKGGADPHAQHRAMMRQTRYKRTEHDYRLPDLQLVGMDGEDTTLLAELNCGKPVMINFVFTTCTTICPLLSGTFSGVQSKLGPDSDDVRMISFSIDPEYDTPERLRAYAKLFDAGPQWRFMTGELADLITVQKAFDVYRGNKMNHEPTMIMRKGEGEPWVRIDGIASAGDVVREYEQLIAH